MKQNEKLLVYAVTGFLMVILGVAILFGKDTTRHVPATPNKTAVASPSLEDILRQQGMLPAEPKPGANPAEAGKANSGKPDAGKPDAGKPDAGKGDGKGVPADASGPSATQGTPQPADLTRLAVQQPLSSNVQLPPTPADEVLTLLGASHHEHNCRIVRVRSGDTLGSVVQRWCGSVGDNLELTKGLNEELTTLKAGQEVVVPWVDDQVVLAAWRERNPSVPAVNPGTGAPASAPADLLAAAVHADAPAVKSAVVPGRLHKIAKGDSLWAIAEKEVGRKGAVKFIAQVKELNPQIEDFNHLKIGVELKLPAK